MRVVLLDPFDKVLDRELLYFRDGGIDVVLDPQVAAVEGIGDCDRVRGSRRAEGEIRRDGCIAPRVPFGVGKEKPRDDRVPPMVFDISLERPRFGRCLRWERLWEEIAALALIVGGCN